jgi:hypothetical protein
VVIKYNNDDYKWRHVSCWWYESILVIFLSITWDNNHANNVIRGFIEVCVCFVDVLIWCGMLATVWNVRNIKIEKLELDLDEIGVCLSF